MSTEAELDYDSDEDDAIFDNSDKKVAQSSKSSSKKPAAVPRPSMGPVSIPEAFQVIGGDRYFRMKLPLLQFAYKDEHNINRYCSIVHMPAGCAEKGIVDFSISGGKVQLMMNATHLMMFDPVKYSQLFRDGHGNQIYMDKDHVKTHGHYEAVKKMKGSSSFNRIIYVFEFQPDIIIDGDKVYDETIIDDGVEKVNPGFMLIKATKGQRPQIFAHFEFKQKVDGHDFAQAESDEDLLEGDEDDESSDSDGVSPLSRASPSNDSTFTLPNF